jgi:leucyl-tRNA synthetase
MLAALMEFNNYLLKAKKTPVVQSDAWDEALRTLILLLAPACPHIAEELWERFGQPYSVHTQPWPVWDEEAAADEVITLVVQVDGKLRDRLQVSAGISEEEARELALASPKAQRHIEGKQVVKIVFVPDQLVNIVVK